MKIRLVAVGALAALLAPAVPAGVASAAPATAAAALASSISVSFNQPTVAREDADLVTQLTGLVDAATSGSTIRVSLPAFTEQAVTDRLLAAQNERQVTVLAVAEQCATRDAGGACTAPAPALTALADGLAAGRFTWCTEGCLTDTGALDAAGFWVFDALTDGRTDVVVQTSADPTATGRRAHQDLVISADDAALATGYRDYFGKLAARQPATFTGSVTSADGRLQAYFSPRAATEPDPLPALIDAVACPGTVRVAAGAWRADRSALLDKLKAKKSAGCTVEVALTDRNDAAAVLASDITVYTYRPGGCRYPLGGTCDLGGLGSTFVLLSGTTSGTGTVVTGPRALSDQQLRRDDSVTLKLTDPTVYQAYDVQWQRLRDEALTVRPDDWPNATWSTVNSVATGDQDVPAMAVNRNGYLAVVWEDDRDSTNPGDPVHSEVFLRLYKDGVSRYEKKLSAGGTSNWRHAQPDVALDDAGNAVVAWAYDADGNGYFDIRVAVVKPDGTVTGTAQANATSGGQQIEPAVGVDPDSGGFAVAWEDIQDGVPATVRVSRYASITSKTYEVQASGTTKTGGGNHRPDVAVSSAGNVGVIWEEDRDANAYFNISLRIFTASGGTKLAETMANANGGGQQRRPSIAMNFNGDIAAAWESDHTGPARVFARMYGPAGAALTGDIAATEDSAGVGDPIGAQSAPQVGVDDQRNAVVAWTEAGYSGPDVWARGFNPDGTTAGRMPATRLSPANTNRQDEPALGVSAWGEVSLVYTDDRDGNGWDQVVLRSGFSNSTW